MNLRTIDIKAFVPARNLARSQAFYQALGFEVRSADAELAVLRHGDCAFLLQAFDAPGFSDNFQMHLLVEDVDAWHAHVLQQLVGSRFGVEVGTPAERPWGMRDFHLKDPDGVLWRIAQNTRPQTGGGERAAAERVSLREITADTVRAITRLDVAPSQRGFVATNAQSLAQALFAPDAWYRAIYLDDEPVGFVMLEDQSLRRPPPERPEIGVWRFMIDQRFQGRGIGDAALRRVMAHARAKGFPKLFLSYMPGPGCPEPFYRRLGFMPNGRMDGPEIVMELSLR